MSTFTPNIEKLCRWIPPEERDYGTSKEHDRVLQSMPLFTAAGSPIIGTGEGKVALLYKLYEQVPGSVYSQVIQRIGDCVSFGWAKAIETFHVFEIATGKSSESWLHPLATEWIYGTSRVLVGRGRLGNGDGSIGSWMAKAVQEHGTLHRKQYTAVDLRRYSGQRAKSWGYRGLPYDMENIADENPVTKVALITSYEQARDSIANGYPVAVCSQQGLTNRRDREGFLRGSGRWAHCMAFTAVDDEYRRPGLLVDNCSWGPNWCSGPKRHEQPDGTGWLDADTCDRMLRQQDSYAVAGYDGFVENQAWSLW